MTVVVDIEEAHHGARIEEIQRLAFGRGEEVHILRLLRRHPSLISLVASVSGIVFGHTVLFEVETVKAPNDYPVRLAATGPIAVDPTQQRRGIGRRLVEELLLEAKREGYDAVIADSRNEFCRHLGFREATDYNISLNTPGGTNWLGVYWLGDPYRSSEPIVVDYPVNIGLHRG